MTLVSDALLTDLRRKMRDHPILVWLDRHEHYTSFVDRLAERRAAGELPFPVLAWRGSHLEMMLALEHAAPGTEPTPMLVHLPGFVEDDVRATPLLELYAAGTRYRIALETLVKQAAGGRVPPEAIQGFLDDEPTSLDAADTWLEERVKPGREGIDATLSGLSPAAMLRTLRTGGPDARKLAAHPEAVLRRLESAVGLPAAWHGEEGILRRPPATADDFIDLLLSWSLAVEYVHDLKRAPYAQALTPATRLPSPVVDACRAIARTLRDSTVATDEALYVRTADETQGYLDDEVRKADAADLGHVDTFRFEEDEVLKAALRELEAENWELVLDWANARASGTSIWLRRDPSRAARWQMLAACAQLGAAIQRAGTELNASDLTSALDRYTSAGAPVDRYHRSLEQHRARYPGLSRFPEVIARVRQVRGNWRSWADRWSVQFNTLCASEGFLPGTSLRQRTLFDEIVRPLAVDSGITAYFMVDALRYEMATALREALGELRGATARLDARYAELPTKTDVGMNALTPVANQGRLTPVFSGQKLVGFHTGQFQVRSPDHRKRVIHDRVGGATCPWLTLKSVLSDDPSTLRDRIKAARVVVVHSLEIDHAGEKGVGLSQFEPALRKLRAAIGALREAGVQNFVITADHGFLLSGEAEGPTRQSRGRKVDNKRRHVVVELAINEAGTVRVPFSALDYQGVDSHLVFPDSTAVFDQGRRDMSFVHGGNSLQERVIPVLTIVHRRKAGERAERWLVNLFPVEPQDRVDGLHAVRCNVVMASQGGLAFGGPPEVELALRVVGAPAVSLELCQVRGDARLRAASAMVRVDRKVTLLFKLTGADQRVAVEVFHPGSAQVRAARVEHRFAVGATGRAAPSATSEPADATWLSELPSGGVRQLFEHLAAHGAVTEAEVISMLGGARQARKFARQFDDHVARAPFDVRIDVVGGVKRYVKQGAS